MAPLTTVRFGLDGPYDLLDKLDFDIQQLNSCETLSAKQVAYAVFNCSVTAWSMVDWVYEMLDAEERKKYAFGGIKRKHFISGICRLIPELEICRQLATGAKHFQVSDRPMDGLTTHILEIGQTPLGGKRKIFNAALISPPDGEPFFADEFFPDVLVRWESFLSRNGIDPVGKQRRREAWTADFRPGSFGSS